jgi:hypothetical protein
MLSGKVPATERTADTRYVQRVTYTVPGTAVPGISAPEFLRPRGRRALPRHPDSDRPAPRGLTTRAYRAACLETPTQTLCIAHRAAGVRQGAHPRTRPSEEAALKNDPGSAGWVPTPGGKLLKSVPFWSGPGFAPVLHRSVTRRSSRSPRRRSAPSRTGGIAPSATFARSTQRSRCHWRCRGRLPPGGNLVTLVLWGASCP